MAMQIHSLGFDAVCEEDYHLIGIHTTLEDYKLAYLLNKEIKTSFSRSNFNLDFTKNSAKTSYSLYNYTNTEYDFDWFLISNNYSEENMSLNKGSLFPSEIKNYLIPEKKNIDFFIKIVGELDSLSIEKITTKIKQIPQVITCYAVDYNTLKSKDFLIF
jgi:hypothetical protein